MRLVLARVMGANPWVWPFHRAISWYKRAAEKGDRRATQRLKTNSNTPIVQPGGPGSVLQRNPDEDSNGKGGKDKDCVIM